MLDALPLGAAPSKAWQYAIPLGPKIFDFYQSQGDVTVSAATTIPTVLDGPIQVARYGTLTINAALTAANRCRGLLIACDNLVLGAAAHIHMDGKGAAGSPKWAIQDITIPSKITLAAKATAYADLLAYIRSTGYAIFDPTLWACPPAGMGDVIADYADWPSLGSAIVSAAGCAGMTVRATGGSRDYGSGTAAYGASGGAGSSAPGGGGGGGGSVPTAASQNALITVGTTGSRSFPWGGGIRGAMGQTQQGGGSASCFASSMSSGDGDPYSTISTCRPGGVLMILIRGNVTAASGHIISANATTDGGAYGGHGGGRVFFAYGGTLTGTLNMTATGASGYSYCGNGGAGAMTATTFSAMGW